MSSPACSNWVRTRYTVARPVSVPSLSNVLYTSSAERCRTVLFSKISRMRSRGIVALRPMVLRSVGEVTRSSRLKVSYHIRNYLQMKTCARHRLRVPPLPMRMFIPLVLLLAGCQHVPMLGLSPHKIDIQQGNYVTQDMVDKLKPGMSRSQVRFALGTPL